MSSGKPNQAAGEPQFRTIHLNDTIKNDTLQFLHNKISTAKYTILSFIFKFLHQEFKKYANVFFLGTAIIQQIPNVSPTSRYTTIIPLSVVLFATAVKEVFEDYRRHKSDDEVNNRSCAVLRGSSFEEVLWRNVQVGDIVRVTNNEFFPADLILLSSSEPDALCYIETSNLDGETNLKIRQGRTETAAVLTPQAARSLDGTIKSEMPNSSLYTFEGTMSLNGQKEFPLEPNQMLLRGAMLRNTRWIYGVVVFTGHESKLMRNATAAPIKRTAVEDMTNRQIVLLFIILLVLAISSALGALGFFNTASKTMPYLGLERKFFLDILTFIVLYNNLIPISLIVTMEVVKLQQSRLINADLDMYYEKSDTPAVARTSSLVEELGQIQYIFSDKTGTLTCNEMEFRECSIGGKCYAGIVSENKKIRFNEKTGAEEIWQQDFKALRKTMNDRMLLKGEERKHAEFVDEFFTLLAVCHTVIPEVITEQIEGKANATPKPADIAYQASSPDENALVNGAQSLGYFFHTRRPKSVIINVLGENREYEILNVCEFNSTRKRMSTIVRGPDGKIKVFVKGADTVILERLKRDTAFPENDARSIAVTNPHVASTLVHLEEYATEGLRTLCIAMREISDEEYAKWCTVYEKASTTINNRSEELDKAAELIEKDLYFLGATAIEDKLQDGVPDCIANLAQAGIKLWVLTGDRQETAINIGFSCKLLSDEMALMIVNEESKAATKDYLMRKLTAIKKTAQASQVPLPSGRYDPDRPPRTILYLLKNPRKVREIFESWGWLSAPKPAPEDKKKLLTKKSREHINDSPVIDGEDAIDPSQINNLALIIDGKNLGYALDPDLEKTFLELATLCKSVICCRVSPLQKALVVKLVKHHLNSITLAIGDGANDVGMIQAAHVGVGISGHEGLQAARSSDFAISQFRYLKKLLLVHGAWSYRRLSKLILYSFYKNITLYMTQFWFAFYNGFSGQTIYESWTISLYNVIFTILPPFAIGVFDQFVSARMLERYPQLYMLGQDREFFNVRTFWGWTINAFYHSVILFYCLGIALGRDNLILGSPSGFSGQTGGMWFIGTLMYTCVLATVLLKATLSTDFWTKYTWIFIPGSFVIWIIFLPIYSVVGPNVGITELEGIERPLLGSAVFWLAVIIVPIICIMRDYIWKYHKRQHGTRTYHVVQEIQKYAIPDYRPHAEKFLKAVNRVRMMQRLRKNRGYAFSQNEEGQADLIRQYDSTQRKPTGM
eukprot:Partr_v1_DN28896_c2_g1_i2_m34255 putative phospholipid-transporting ATPase